MHGTNCAVQSAKVAGVEGDFEELLVKARFEEARIRDFRQGVKSFHNTSKAFSHRRAETESKKDHPQSEALKQPATAIKAKDACWSSS